MVLGAMKKIIMKEEGKIKISKGPGRDSAFSSRVVRERLAEEVTSVQKRWETRRPATWRLQNPRGRVCLTHSGKNNKAGLSGVE